jgi:hypothetical protein
MKFLRFGKECFGKKSESLEDSGSHEHCPFAEEEEEFLEEKTTILIILFNF